MRWKESIRRMMLKRRENIEEWIYISLSEKVNRNIITFLKETFPHSPQKPRNGYNIGMYMPIRKEVDIRKSIQFCKANGYKVYLPCMEDKNIIYREFTSFKELVKGRYNVLCPNELKTRADNLDVVFVPGVAFDILGGRIGYGKGYFDMYLSKADKNMKKVGVAFSFQLVDQLSTEVHDVKMDFIITDKSIVKCFTR